MPAFHPDRSVETGSRPLIGGSISLKLPLFIGALIAVVIAINTWGTYRTRTAADREFAQARLAGAADEFVDLLDESRREYTAHMALTAQSPAVRAVIAGRPARVPPPVTDAMARLREISPGSAIELRDAAGRVVAALPDGQGATAHAFSDDLRLRAAAADSAVVGRLRLLGGSLAVPVAMRVTDGGALLGYVVQWRPVLPPPMSWREVASMIGSGGRLFVGNTDDSIWTDLTARVPRPAGAAGDSDRGRTGGAEAGGVLAVARAVPATPWSVVVEFPVDSVMAPAIESVHRLLLINALTLLLGLIGAWLLSRRFTRRLGALTSAAESMGAPRPAPGADAGGTGDELSRLARAFDAMQARVHEALDATTVSERLYRTLFDSVPTPLYVVDAETLQFLAVNTAAEEHYGYAREEFLTMTLRDIRPPEDVPRLEATIQAMGDRPERQGTWRHFLKDGTPITVDVVAHTLTFNGRPAVLTLATDVTARNDAAEALRRSEERYRRLIQEAPFGIELTTIAGRMFDANPALARMLGYDTPDELIGRSILGLYVEPAEREAALRDVQSTGYTRRDSVHWRRRDGHVITVRFSARLVQDPERGEPYIETMVEDVTERLRLEAQFHQSQKMEAIGRLAGGIAHDFNNLLTVILTTTELLLDSAASDGDLHAELQDIYRSAQRGAELTRQLLAFSRRQVLSIHPMSVNQLVVGVERLLRRVLGEDVDLRVTPRAEPDIVRADSGQLEQVLMNLAVNARDAMPNGGRLGIETALVELSETIRDRQVAMPAGRYVQITVSDTGEGMPPEVKEHLFEPFFTTKPRDKGTGLGLATVYGIVKQLGGFVWVYSEVGEGTTFKIYLPCVGEAPRERVASAARRGELDGTETVLLAEDEPGIRSLLTRVLASRGYEVLAAASGEEALALSTAHPAPIHLLVT
ncbi:MAG TPA: PAS domain S-box protein, partial [Gemmatimonadaceae bacterium]